MDHTTNDVLGRAAYLRRSCEILLHQLTQVDGMAVTGTEDLTPVQEAAVGNANQRHAERAKDHIELAGQYIADWHRALTEALSTEPSWVR